MNRRGNGIGVEEKGNFQIINKFFLLCVAVLANVNLGHAFFEESWVARKSQIRDFSEHKSLRGVLNVYFK